MQETNNTQQSENTFSQTNTTQAKQKRASGQRPCFKARPGDSLTIQSKEYERRTTKAAEGVR